MQNCLSVADNSNMHAAKYKIGSDKILQNVWLTYWRNLTKIILVQNSNYSAVV